MFVRSLLLGLIAVVGFAGTAEAAKVTKFIVTCVDRTDATDDDVFLAGTRDGKAIPWGEGFQAGTSVGNTANLSEKDANEMSFALDAKSLAEMVFTDTLEVSVKEKDLTVEQLIGILKIGPQDGHKTVTLKGGAGDDAFEYRVEYEVAP